jgi:tRNA1(Val) A37 N6-methylase TrmN6
MTKNMKKTNDNSNEVIETTLLRGRVRLLQPKIGFHASLDTVFLAAAIPSKNNANVLDVGCGVGSAGLCALSRNGHMRLVGLDIQRELIDLALQNAALNGLEEHCHFFRGDLLSEKVIPDNNFNVVLMNPPYMEGGTHTPSPRRNKALSHGEDASGAKLQDWVKYAHRKLKNGGTLVMIHRADRLDDVIVALEQRRWFGSLEVYPLWSKAGEDAKRVIIRARKERYAPLVLKAGLIIHEKSGQYTDGAQRILSAAEAIDM